MISFIIEFYSWVLSSSVLRYIFKNILYGYFLYDLSLTKFFGNVLFCYEHIRHYIMIIVQASYYFQLRKDFKK